MPRFSIIVPTYNRRDTIMRAIGSILAQTFGDYEVLVTDDGSVDGTGDLLVGVDPRISVQWQKNAGIAPARNAAIRRSKGEYIAFLDSDDEWLPHYLELANAFFTAHPGEHLFSGEFWIDYASGQYEKHFRASMDWYLPTAKRIGLGGLSLPPGEGDDYLRFYEKRAEVGDWGRAIVDKLPHGKAHYYTGNIFQNFRWGYLLAAQSTILSRAALERIGGELDVTYPIGCDFGFLALACKHFTAHMVSTPVCIKHEFAGKGARLAEGHLATGATAMQFAKDLLRWHETLFWNERPTDPELSALRACAQLYVARLAIDRGLTDEAVAQLSSAVAAFPGPEAKILLRLVTSLPPKAARAGSRSIYGAKARYQRVSGRVKGLLGRLDRSRKSGGDGADEGAERPDPPSSTLASGPIGDDLRMVTPGDMPALMRLRAATHGATSIFADPTYFDWVYRQRPAAVGKPSELWLQTSGSSGSGDGGIYGQVGAAHVELKVGSARHQACWLFDLAVDERARGKGTAGALSRVVCSRVEAAMALEVTGGGRRVLLKSGWLDMGMLTLFVRPIDVSTVARRVAGLPLVGGVGNGLFSAVAAIGKAGAGYMGLTSEEVPRFDDRADAIWEKASGAYCVAVRRDQRLLNWRFADFPERGRYRIFYFSRQGSPVGYAVLRVGERHGASAGYIVDFFCEPRFTYGILAQCVDTLARDGVAAVYCLHSNPVSTAPLLGLGFIPRSSGWPFVADVTRLAGGSAKLASDPRNWFITAGDGDVDRPEHAIALDGPDGPGVSDPVAGARVRVAASPGV